MSKRFHSKLAGVLSSALLLFPLWTQAQTDTWYQVEVLIFSNPAGGTAEQWDAIPTLAYPTFSTYLSEPNPQAETTEPQEQALFLSAEENPLAVTASRPLPGQPTPFITLPASELEFRGAAARMQRSGRYRNLFHKVWTQPIGSQSEAIPIVLDQSGDDEYWPALQGTITLYVSRYLYLETNLWLNTAGDYLQSAWQMPPPPLGPRTSTPNDSPSEPERLHAQPSTVQVQPTPQEAQELSPVEESVGPEYPYGHAVLLQQTRRMRSSEVNYIDHPMLGVVVKVTPVKTDEPEPAPEPLAQNLSALPLTQ
jgi:hypothetical protein